MGVKCFLLEPTAKAARSLRRYALRDDARCPSEKYSYHNAEVFLDYIEKDGPDDIGRSIVAEVAREFSSLWPIKCAACDYMFLDSDSWQISVDPLYKRSDTGEEIALSNAPPGAMWNAYWYGQYDDKYVGPDGKTMIVVCPNGVHWNIDSRCNNCDSPCENCGVAWKDHDYDKCPGYKDAKPHKCWNRTGEPPLLTVGKGPGPTCGAGAGSILAGDYHGFLRNGEFDP